MGIGRFISNNIYKLLAVTMGMAVLLGVPGCSFEDAYNKSTSSVTAEYIREAVPEYSGRSFEIVNENEPFFEEDELTTEAFEEYSGKDELGRCGTAYANVCEELLPDEKRGDIGMIKPSGWQTAKYTDIVEGNYLYNRCHLIGYQLTGENANDKNLITGTRWFNVQGMLPFENAVAEYVRETDNHVLYRVTPVYEGDALVALGVEMEARSVEDDSICFNVFVYNIQPGIEIDYDSGVSELADDYEEEIQSAEDAQKELENEIDYVVEGTLVSLDNVNSDDGYDVDTNEEMQYVLNIKSKKFHMPYCEAVEKMSSKNRQEFFGERNELIKDGYEPCGTCRP